MEHHNACPACGSSQIQFCFNSRDNSVSGQEFAIWECKDCTLRFTRDVPSQHEIGPFYQAEAYISHTDSQKGYINRVYHLVRMVTMRRKLRLIQNISGMPAGRLLDIGAGTGLFCHTMKNAGWNVTGLEPDGETRNWAKEHRGIDLLSSDSLFTLAPGADVVTLWHVMEHVHALHEYLDQIAKLLTEGGKLVIAVPNYTSFDAKKYGKDWAAYDVPRHLYHFSPASMEELLQHHGFRILSFKPMWFDSFYVSMLTEKYKGKFPGVVRAFFIGALSNLFALLNTKKCSSVIYIAEKKRN